MNSFPFTPTTTEGDLEKGIVPTHASPSLHGVLSNQEGLETDIYGSQKSVVEVDPSTEIEPAGKFLKPLGSCSSLTSNVS